MAEPPATPVAAHLERILAAVPGGPSGLPGLPGSAGLAGASELVPLADAVGRVSAHDLSGALPVPGFDHAAMDGYAVRSVDVVAVPATLPVVGVVAAGSAWPRRLEPGTCLRIMTGAPVPDGADAVVPFEWTDRGAATMTVDRAVAPGRHVRRCGEDVAAGATAVPAGTVLAPRHLGLLASIGCAEVAVRRRPRVAVVPTGAELVAHDRGDGPSLGAVPESNSAVLAAAVRAVGGEPAVLGPVGDDPSALLAALEQAAEGSDLVVTTGGVSAGDHDVVKAALGTREGFWFGSVAVKPGRPQGAGVVVAGGREVPVVCLPGTPVAAYSTFLMFAVPVIRVLSGRPPAAPDRAALAAGVRPAPDRTLLLPAAYDADGRVRPLPGHVGHSQALLAEADVLLVLPPAGTAGETTAPIGAGAVVDVVRLDVEVP
jgi:molybdopterin molybdotransferase